MRINSINNISFQGAANKKPNKAKKANKTNKSQDVISLSSNKKDETKKKKGINKKGVLAALAGLAMASGAVIFALGNKNKKRGSDCVEGVSNNNKQEGTQSTSSANNDPDTANVTNAQNTTNQSDNKINEVSNVTPKEYIYTKEADVEYKANFIEGLKEVYGLDKKVEDIQSIMGPYEFSELLKKLDGDDLMFHENAVDFMERIQKKREPELEAAYVPKSGSEYHNYLNNEMPKEEHENYRRPLIDGTCRLYLTSQVDYDIADPKEAAKYFLDRAVEYADKVAKKVQDDKPAFTVGILERDGIAIHQEIAKELAQNPEKYKNLKVIFGIGGVDKHDKIYHNKTEYRNYFINPFDKELIKCCEEAEEKRMNTLKSLFKNVYILPDGETTHFGFNLVKNSKSLKKYYKDGVPENWRTLTDKEIDEFLNDPTIKRYRKYEKDNESILEEFYTRYLAPHIEDEIEFGINKSHIRDVFERVAKKNLGWTTGNEFDYVNYTMPEIDTFKEIIEKQKFQHTATPENDTWFAMMFDQFDIRDFCKNRDNAYNTRKEIPEGVASTFDYFAPKGQEYDIHALPTNEQITGMLDKENKKINMFYPNFKPTKYIFGDRIKITDDLWKKIIE